MSTFSFEGVEVTPGEAGTLVERQLQDGSVWSGREDWRNADGIVRLLEAIPSGALRDEVLAAVLASATSDDVGVRQQAVAVIGEVPASFPAGGVLEILTRSAPLFEGVPKSEGSLPIDLASVLWQALASHPDLDQQGLAAVRVAATRADYVGDAVLGPLTRRDPEWVMEHAPDVMAGQARRAVYAVFGLEHAAQRQRFFAALAGGDAAFRAAVADAIRQHADEPEASALAAAVLER